ncbi:hypothetical protein ACSVHC_22315 [Arthrobacter sp. KNU-44]|uniref:hypothetical protein n=1 Tax=unclassified Arthrobacter TaxID=235627 RepID=UPI003F42CFE5
MKSMILVTGGAGTLGRLVASRACRTGAMRCAWRAVMHLHRSKASNLHSVTSTPETGSKPMTLLTARAMAKLPVVPVPKSFQFQPVDLSEDRADGRKTWEEFLAERVPGAVRR